MCLCQATAHDAFRALVNLSDNSLVAASLSEPMFLTFLVSYILVRAFFLSTPIGHPYLVTN